MKTKITKSINGIKEDHCESKLIMSLMQRMNLLKILGHQKWGASKNILLRLYTMIIRSKMEYGCIVLQKLKSKQKKILRTIENTAIRIAIGAMRTSPVDSLKYEAGILPIDNHIRQLFLCYIAKIASMPKSPLYNQIFEDINNSLPIKNRCPLREQISNDIQTLNIQIPPITKQ